MGLANFLLLGARPRGRTTTHASKKSSEKVLGRVLGKGSQKKKGSVRMRFPDGAQNDPSESTTP